MSTFPGVNYMNDNARTQGHMKTAFEQITATLREMEGGGNYGTATLATDAFTLADNVWLIILDTESATTSDDLKNIAQTTARDGRTVLIRPANNNHNVVVRNNAGGVGQIFTQDGADWTMTSTLDSIRLRYNANLSPVGWEEIGRTHARQINRLPGMAEETNLTITSDAITPTQHIHELTCETGTPGSATDNLSTINQTNPIKSLILHTKTAGDVVTVKNNTGSSPKILTVDGADITLDSPNKFVFLMQKSTTWEEIARWGFTLSGHTLQSKSATFTASAGDYTYICTNSITANLPTLAAAAAGNARITIVNDGTGTVTLDPNGSEVIQISESDTDTTLVLLPGTSITIVPGASMWRLA